MAFNNWLEEQAAQGNPLAQRLLQHTATIDAQMAQGGLGGAKDSLWNTIVGTLVGLPLEASATTGKAATGALAAGVGQLAGQGPDTPSGRAYQAYQQGGGDFFQGGRAANEALASGSKGDAFLTGLLNAALDPANFLAGPASEASKAAKAGKVAGIAERATGGLSPEFHAALATLDEASKAAEAKPALGDIYNKYDAMRQLGDARQAVQEAADNREAAGVLYKATQQSKTQAAREAKRGVLDAVKEGNLEITGGPDALKRFIADEADNAKTAVTEGIVGLPQRGQTYRQYMQPHEESFRRAVAQEQQARKDIMQALSAPQTSGLSPADVGLLGATEVPQKALQRMTAANAVDMNLAGDVLNRKGKVIPGTEGLGGQVNDVLAGQEGIREGAKRLATTTAPDGSQPLQEKGYAGVMVDVIKHAFSEGWQAQRAAMQQEGVLPGLKQVPAIWKQNLIQTPRNILMDWAYMRAILANEGVRAKALNDAEKQIGQAILSGEMNPMQLLGHATDDLNSVGFDAKAWAERNGVAVGGKGQPKTAEEAFLKQFGVAPFYDMLENANNISAMQYLVGHLAMAPANALRGDIPALALPLTAARGYLAPLRNRAFHIINNVTHGAARGEAFRLSFRDALNSNAEELLGAAEAMGRDVGELRNMGTKEAGAGLFSPEMVRERLGPEFAAEWQRMTDASVQAGFERANQVFGNFASRNAGERLVGMAVPLMSWSWRAYPRVAGLVLSHPAVAAATLQLYEAERRTGEAQHLPSYQYGTVAIPTDMPLLGALARVFTPQQEGAVRLNPLALINPAGGGALAMGTEESAGGQTPYQAVQGAVEAVGGSFNPLITTLAYLTGGDYRAPGPLDRYANIDEAMNDLPGMQGTPTLPTIQAPLRAARKALGNAPDTYDVVEAKAKELVYERTGLPLADARNRDFARQIQAKEGIYREAEHILDTSGATRTAFNAVTPVSVQMSTRTADERRQAAAGAPWTYAQIQQMQAISPTLAEEMQREADDYARANPAAAIGKDAKLPKAGSMDEFLQQAPAGPYQRAIAEFLYHQAQLAKKKK